MKYAKSTAITADHKEGPHRAHRAIAQAVWQRVAEYTFVIGPG